MNEEAQASVNAAKVSKDAFKYGEEIAYAEEFKEDLPVGELTRLRKGWKAHRSSLETKELVTIADAAYNEGIEYSRGSRS